MTNGSGPTFTTLGMLAHADVVVQAVVAVLGLCSVVCWAIIFEKIARIVTLRRAIARVEDFARYPTSHRAAEADTLLGRMLEEFRAEAECKDGLPHEVRPRLASALRAVGVREVRSNEAGLSFLATLASTAPFVGLFGTVWGIMHSFTAISEAQDTSLASVAPGIAEALLATAVGLAAAIPAVIGYNQFRAAFTRCGHRLALAAAMIARTSTVPVPEPAVEQ